MAGLPDYCGCILSDKDVQQRVVMLRNLIEGHERLKTLRKEDPFMLRFLHSVDFNVDDAFEKMIAYCNTLYDFPHWFADESTLEMRRQILQNDKLMLRGRRNRDREGRVIMFQFLERVDIATSNGPEQARIIELYLESIMDDPEIQAAGMSFVLDLKGFSFKVLHWLTPTNIKLTTKRLDIYPLKTLLCHVVNRSLVLNVAIKIVWPFLSAKVKEIFKFHFDDWASLHEYIDPEVLPPEYGGTGPELDFERNSQTLFDMDAEIADRIKYHKRFHNNAR